MTPRRNWLADQIRKAKNNLKEWPWYLRQPKRRTKHPSENHGTTK